MDAVTYPNQAVQKILRENFVCHSIDESRPSRADRQLLRQSRVLWSPAVLCLEPRAGELRRITGFRPPDDFSTELRIMAGLHALLHRKFDRAMDLLASAAAESCNDELTAEALYWDSIAEFKSHDRDYSILEQGWQRLQTGYSHTSWWPRADIWDFRPTGRRAPGGSE